ncbi:MAG: NDP-sugar synthase [Nitrososphaerales archaeon]|nr:NDP-sugar synthase [Nitrososphaerales archaeon]
MKAVILAGGYGTRLWPITLTRPKPMLPLGGRPALYHIIGYLSNHGFEDITITTNYLREQIMDYFGDGSELGVKLTYTDEEFPLGTAGSVKNVANYLGDTFAVIQGDNITDIDLSKMLEVHRMKKAVATIALKEVEDPSLFGVAKLGPEDQVLFFKEKPKIGESPSNLINTGIYILEPEILELIPIKTEYDFAKDFFPELLSKKRMVYGFRAKGFWADIGHIKGYFRALDWILSRSRNRILKEGVENVTIKGPVSIGRDTRVDGGVTIYGPSMIGDRCYIRSGAMINSYSVIESDVEVEKDTNIEKSMIYRDAIIGPSSSLSRCIIAEGCKIGSGVKIGNMSVIGANCEIGPLTRVLDGSRIWPGIRVEPKCTVKGFVKHLEQIFNEQTLAKLASEPVFEERVEKETAIKILARLPPERAFYFFKGIGEYIGQVASSLEEFCTSLTTIDVGSIEFHMSRDDFRNWISFIGDSELARLTKECKERNLKAEALRRELHNLVKRRCEGLRRTIGP